MHAFETHVHVRRSYVRSSFGVAFTVGRMFGYESEASRWLSSFKLKRSMAHKCLLLPVTAFEEELPWDCLKRVGAC